MLKHGKLLQKICYYLKKYGMVKTGGINMCKAQHN